MEIVPEANFGIEICKNGTPAKNAIFLASETDYMLNKVTKTSTTVPVFE